MEIRRFLAMTGKELAQAGSVLSPIGWMACHFSGDGGITNVPSILPSHSLLILDDSTPPQNVKINHIRETIGAALHRCNCYGLLLDFQRRDFPENQAVAKDLVSLPFPVAVSEPYGNDLSCPIFLPPPPLDMPLREYLAPFQGREIWLEMALGTLTLTLTPQGCARKAGDCCQDPLPFSDESLHCRYRIDCENKSAVFTLKRTKEDLHSLLKEAEGFGVTHAVGLYQELGEM